MAATRIMSFSSTKLRLEIPMAHFERLPAALGAVVTDAPDGTRLLALPDMPGCAMRFLMREGAAHLIAVQLEGDVRGRFFQQVLGALMIEYRGDMDCEIKWAPRGGTSNVVVVNGETEDPLLMSLVAAKDRADGDSRVEELLSEARDAWAEYQKTKAGRGVRDV
ncbi:MAG: hypothetical protein K1X89_00205 [Myxococcaceae bacterium]|nr:hypothetical protein [Myxococcaceae bacterium]